MDTGSGVTGSAQENLAGCVRSLTDAEGIQLRNNEQTGKEGVRWDVGRTCAAREVTQLSEPRFGHGSTRRQAVPWCGRERWVVTSPGLGSGVIPIHAPNVCSQASRGGGSRKEQGECTPLAGTQNRTGCGPHSGKHAVTRRTRRRGRHSVARGAGGSMRFRPGCEGTLPASCSSSLKEEESSAGLSCCC